jgi:hypothetical protein
VLQRTERFVQKLVQLGPYSAETKERIVDEYSLFGELDKIKRNAMSQTRLSIELGALVVNGNSEVLEVYDSGKKVNDLFFSSDGSEPPFSASVPAYRIRMLKETSFSEYRTKEILAFQDGSFRPEQKNILTTVCFCSLT